MVNRLFVYGSLQPGGPNHHILREVEGCWRRGWARGHLIQDGWGSALGYPAIRLDDEGPCVSGQLLTSDRVPDLLNDLDEFEGEAYQRTMANIKLEDGSTEKAYVYVLRTESD